MFAAMYVHLTKLMKLSPKNHHEAHGKGGSVHLRQVAKRPKPVLPHSSPKELKTPTLQRGLWEKRIPFLTTLHIAALTYLDK